MTEEQRIDGLLAVLRSNADMAEHSSLTGAFRKSAKSIKDTYNKVYSAFKKIGLLDEDLFQPADESASIDDVGVMSKHMLIFLEAVTGRVVRRTKAAKEFGRAFPNFGETFGKFSEVFEQAFGSEDATEDESENESASENEDERDK